MSMYNGLGSVGWERVSFLEKPKKMTKFAL